MRRILLVLVLLGLDSLPALAQAPAQAPAPPKDYPVGDIERIKAKLRRTDLPDTVRVKDLALLARALQSVDLPAARDYTLQRLGLVRRIGYRRQLPRAYLALGNIDANSGNYLAAERWYANGMAAAQQLHDTLSITDALNGMGSVASLTGDGRQAVRYFQQMDALLALQRPPDPRQRLIAKTNLSAAYGDMKDYQATVRINRQCLALLDQSDALPELRMTILVNLALGLKHLNRLDSAQLLLTQSQQLAIASRDDDGLSSALNALALLALDRQQWAVAEKLARQSLALAVRLGNQRHQETALHHLATSLHAQHRPGAYEALDRYLVLHDTLVSRDRSRAIATAHAQFNDVEQQAQIQSLQQQRRFDARAQALSRQRLWTLGAALAAVLAGLTVAAVQGLRLRRSRNELATARATQDRLYSLVAHDLRSPVAAFEGLSDLLGHYVARQDAVGLASLGGMLNQAAQSLRSLLENLLSWALHQRGELTAAPQAVPAADVLAETVALYQATATAANITLSQTAPPDLQLWADANMSRTIVRNLVGNALKATPNGGTVSLTAAVAGGGTATIVVQDTGSGFGTGQLGRPAARRPQSAADRAGLGLLLSRAFANAQGGTLTLGNAEGGGAVAVLTLPTKPV